MMRAHSQHNSPNKFNLTLLLVDHYDSYTYNLYNQIAFLCQEPPLVVNKDIPLSSLPPNVDGFILSPGPGRPPQDTGVSLDIIREYPETPILGVCLGHQALGYAYGASVKEAPIPIHGQVHAISLDFTNCALWHNITSPINVTRYHSLVVNKWSNSTQIPLQATAWHHHESSSSIVMALCHTTNPHFGVQFHPESIGTLKGMTIMKNFLHVCHDVKQQQHDRRLENACSAQTMSTAPLVSNGALSVLTNYQGLKKKQLQLFVRRVVAPKALPSDVFTRLYQNHSFAAWLDSSASNAESRISIVAAMNGPLSKRIEYFVDTQQVCEYNNDKTMTTHDDIDILSFLEHDMESHHVVNQDEYELPFEYRGGYLGFLGYEVRHDTQRFLQQRQQDHEPTHEPRRDSGKTPSAAFLFADQSLVYDHVKKEWYLMGLSRVTDDSSILKWMDQVERVLLQVEPTLSVDVNALRQSYRPLLRQPLAFVPNRSPQCYHNNIAACHEAIRLGESYELCLTNQLEARVSSAQSPLDLYKLLRKRNPVPFAAFLNFQQGIAPLSICCSSPERFVSVKRQSPSIIIDDARGDLQQTHLQDDSFHVEAKPIKGTCARHIATNRPPTLEEVQEDKHRARTLQTCIKNRAENLMIVDLLRNDLNRVCQVGSVHVPKLMEIESFATVHQMVSTIRGVLRKNKNAIDVLRATFPGGSMTGAPKLRSMEILNELEEGVPRGPYSGCLGYISLNGSMDMNIVIRSAVLTPDEEDGDWHVRIGAGGAITALSESEDEYEEMLLKARAVVEAVQAWSDTPSKLTEEQKVSPTIPLANMTLTVPCK